MLIVEPRGGLCNRMRVVDSAVRLAALLGGRPMRLLWRIDEELGAPFETLFESIPDLEDVTTFDLLGRHREEDVAAFSRACRSEFVIDDAMSHAIEAIGVDPASLGRHAAIHIRTWRNFMPSHRPAAHFTPVAPLRERVARIASGFSRTAGVHVRRTDLLAAADNSPTEMFEARMRALLDSGEVDGFFLSTDSPAVEARLRAAFPGLVASQEGRSLDRRRREAIADAVVDLYSLGATRKVLGSYMSSFSVTAASIADIPLEIVRRPVARRPSTSDGRPKPRFSIAIATRGRADGLERLLAALRPQVAGRQDREIVVVNDGSHDAAYQSVAERHADIAGYSALPAHVGIPAARNAAAEQCRGDYLLFTDDDCVPPDGWIDWLDARLRLHPEIDAIAGTTDADIAPTSSFAARVQAHFNLLPQPRLDGRRVLFVTANLAMRRSLFERLGGFGFREGFPGAGEDVELAVRADMAGARVCLDWTCKVVHALDRRLWTQVRRYWRYGYSNVWMTRFMTAPSAYRDLFWIRRSGHGRHGARFFRDARRQAATFSANPFARIAAAAMVALVRLAYFDGCAQAAGERLRAERLSRGAGG
jgi:GT2 family glycosyltransferase